MVSDVRARQGQTLLELDLRQRVLTGALIDESQRHVAPGVVGGLTLETLSQATRLPVIVALDQVDGQAPKGGSMGRQGVQRPAEGVDGTLQVVVSELGEAGRVAEVLVEDLRSGEVQTETSEATAVGRLDRQVGDKDQIPGVQVDVLIEEPELEPELGLFLRLDLLGILLHRIRRPVEHTPCVEIDLLLPHEAAERHQVGGVVSIQLQRPAQGFVRF